MRQNMKYQDLTQGKITSGLWKFALPLMLGNVMQQLYNLADTWVVGRYVGSNALAAVGSSYTLMTFLTSIVIGLCLGSSAFISQAFGKKDDDAIRNGIFLSFCLTFLITVVIMVVFYALLDCIIVWMQIPDEIQKDMHIYLFYVFIGFGATFLYNYISNLLRGVGNSVIPLFFLGISVVLNIGLDLFFVIGLRQEIFGAAIATVIAQFAAGVGIFLYFLIQYPEYHLKRKDRQWNRYRFGEMMRLSGYTALQQSVMNLGILVVQGIVNSFGAVIMAAFAIAVKIDTIAYMPVQDFGNAFSVFAAQNYGAGKQKRLKSGIRQAFLSVVVFSVTISLVVCLLARPLMSIFVEAGSHAIIQAGVTYLRIEGAFYIGIGILFLLYGYYRAVSKPVMSVVLTVISLGSRVVLAYLLSRIPVIGVIGIWVSIPIGWFLADLTGILYYKRIMSKAGRSDR